jgi:sugar-specific transcriptional regulator TrmB
MPMIEDILKQLGFGNKEVKVYLAILEQGKTTPAHLATLTGIKRTTVYSISKELLDKGVIVEDIAGPHSFLVALPPEDLKNIAKKEERELQNKKILIDQAVTELQNFTKDTKYSIPKITFIYEEDLENFLYKQTPEWNRSVMASDGIWWGFQDPSFPEQYKKWIDWFWNESAPKDLVLKLLSNQTQNEKQIAKLYDRRLIKYWNGEEGNFTGSTLVAGDYILLIITGQKPHYLVQIYDATLAHNMRQLFMSIWESQEK